MTHFARALGAARLGDRATARSGIEALRQARDRLTAAAEDYWAGQVEIERRSATAWLARAEGRMADALAEMRGAAEMEDATEKNAMTPGPLAPARELLGDMLLEAGQPGLALREFEATLQKEPDRYRALAGAARAAAQAGDRATATKHYGRLLKVCARADDPGRTELVEARRFTASAATAP
jgi:tetratricopeptide (TPR) repeat protein